MADHANTTRRALLKGAAIVSSLPLAGCAGSAVAGTNYFQEPTPEERIRFHADAIAAEMAALDKEFRSYRVDVNSELGFVIVHSRWYGKAI